MASRFAAARSMSSMSSTGATAMDRSSDPGVMVLDPVGGAGEKPIELVRMESLALLKIVKHCHESLPQMVTGSLLGLVVTDGEEEENGDGEKSSGRSVLEITHAFPFPSEGGNNKGGDDSGAAAIDGQDFQLEMMRMLREVNVDNNCVGWYQSMYLGSFSTMSFLENQWSYQTDLSKNAVVILYDPMQTTHGNLVFRCFRLSEAAMKTMDERQKMQQQQQQQRSRDGSKAVASSVSKPSNEFVDPQSIFEELPVEMSNPGLIRAFLADLAAPSPSKSSVTDFSRLDLSTNPYLEKHLEFLCSWVDDLASEQQKFQYYARSVQRAQKQQQQRDKKGDTSTGNDPNAIVMPSRMESLLLTNQIHTYCQQVDKFSSAGFGKLFLAGALHKKE